MHRRALPEADTNLARVNSKRCSRIYCRTRRQRATAVWSEKPGLNFPPSPLRFAALELEETRAFLAALSAQSLIPGFRDAGTFALPGKPLLIPFFFVGVGGGVRFPLEFWYNRVTSRIANRRAMRAVARLCPKPAELTKFIRMARLSLVYV